MTDIILPKVELDPRNEQELIQLAYTRINEASNGVLNDFRPGSPLAALVEGQMFITAELFYYMNMLPEALAIETFRLLGVTRKGSTPSGGNFRFILTNSLGTAFILNPGYSIPYNGSFFVLQEQLVIPPGALEGQAFMQANAGGEFMNAEPFQVFITTTQVTFLQTVYNEEATTGGADLEELSDTILRAQQQLRSRDVIVSITDYELAAQKLVGIGSRAVAIPFLTSDKLTTAVGNVHVFCVDGNGTPISEGQADDVKSDLQPQVFAASQVWVSPAELENITTDVIVSAELASEEVASAIGDAVISYLNPTTYPWGEKVKPSEIAHAIRRNVPEVFYVDSVSINNNSQPYLLPTAWSVPFADTIIISIMQPDGVSQTYFRGLGGDEE